MLAECTVNRTPVLEALGKRAREALKALKKMGSAKHRAGYARYGIVAPKSFGVPMGKIQALGKKLGKDHALAEALWRSGWYEARLLAAYVEDPAQVTAARMDRWATQFNNWAVCDTITFAGWDRTPHAWKTIVAWSRRKEEFVKRASFALLAAVALHDKSNPEPKLHAASLALCERLIASEAGASAWVGRDAKRDLTRPAVVNRIKEKKP